MDSKMISLWLLILSISLCFCPLPEAAAGNPDGATYSDDNSRIFWFAIISDTHIGTTGSNDSTRLNSFLDRGYKAIKPSLVIVTGDLTDHVRCSLFTGGRTCNHPSQWAEYKRLVRNRGMSIDLYSEAPGNHDQYWESVPLTLYLGNSIEGTAMLETQRSWLLKPSFGTYHFITTATPHPGYTNAISDGTAGSPGELSQDELDFVEAELVANHDSANLTFVFGHHPIQNLAIGQSRFLSLLGDHGVSLYGFGHTHRYSSSSRLDGGVLNLNVDSLWEHNAYALVAVDNDGVSVAPAQVGQWPVVLITAPVDAGLGGVNPYAYPVYSSTANPIRALVFDQYPVSRVLYRIDGSAVWLPMTKVRRVGGTNSYLWETRAWDTSSLSPGMHTLEVKATGSSTRSRAIIFEVKVE